MWVKKGIIFPIRRPRTAWNLGELNKSPMDFSVGFHAKVVTDGRGDVNSGAVILGVFWWFISKDILPVIGGEGAAVFPLRVADPFTVNDLHPPTFTGCFSRPFIQAVFPPWDYTAGCGMVISVVEAIIEWQGDVKRVESRDKRLGSILDTCCCIWVVIAAVVLLPLCIP